MSFKSSRRASTQSPNQKLFNSTVLRFEETRQQFLKESVHSSLKRLFVDGVIRSITRTEFKKEHFKLAIERVEEIFREIVDCDRERYLKKLIEQYAILKTQFVETEKLLKKSEVQFQIILEAKTTEIEALMIENLKFREQLAAQAQELIQFRADQKSFDNQVSKQKEIASKLEVDLKRSIGKSSQFKIFNSKEEFSKNFDCMNASDKGKPSVNLNKDNYKKKYRKYKDITKSLRDKLILFEETVKEFEKLNELQRAKIRQMEENLSVFIQREVILIVRLNDLESQLRLKDEKLEFMDKEKQQ